MTQTTSKRLEQSMRRIMEIAASDAAKDNEIERRRNKALGDAVARLIENADEAARVQLFTKLEAVAKAADRKLIAAHPLRPVVADAPARGAEKVAGKTE
ncbi:hypothetical protein OE699_09365 [Sedimentimonas flavescens]|uniref:Glutamyl-tRNA amidotransferase n=1 Tax=Sedimentimonas flavescens TaxID=2851012 RepID=A0ABT2ZZ68_9RHOB|nr:hypothetical protein [Sedimentimonas flavescens]MCV2879063.1 hypothetical protein [Sedimentimonas flavescens]